VTRHSQILIAYNNEPSIERCLRSASFANEAVAIDGGITDKSAAIAASCGARVVAPDWPGFGLQKNRALQAATGDWVLSLDADEWIEPPLAAELTVTIAGADTADQMPRRSSFCGVSVNHCDWWSDYVLRLFRRLPTLSFTIASSTVGSGASPSRSTMRQSSMPLRRRKRSSTTRWPGQVIWPKAAIRPADSAPRFTPPAPSRGTFILQAGFLDGVTGWREANYNRRYAYRKWQALRSMRQ
jgi:glycosyltransferase involved in cell wall biosynthesis